MNVALNALKEDQVTASIFAKWKSHVLSYLTHTFCSYKRRLSLPELLRKHKVQRKCWSLWRKYSWRLDMLMFHSLPSYVQNEPCFQLYFPLSKSGSSSRYALRRKCCYLWVMHNQSNLLFPYQPIETRTAIIVAWICQKRPIKKQMVNAVEEHSGQVALAVTVQ